MATATRNPTISAPNTNGLESARALASDHIVIRGGRQNNLKDIDLDLPRDRLIVITGPSGSGKSSLAFDTIYAEGQRRYVESLSAYARQFLERMDKPDADLITGLAPAIAIEQKTTSRNPRSTVATQTEIYDHLRLLFGRIGRTISPASGEEVTRDSPRSVAERLESGLDDAARFYVCFPLPRHKKTKLARELDTLKARGFYRLLVLPTPAQSRKGSLEEVIDLNQVASESVRTPRARLLVLVDRLAVKKGDESSQSRIADSVELAFREGGGYCSVRVRGGDTLEFSEYFERDGIRFEEPNPQTFSFNSPLGACPTCQGFGRVAGLDPDLIIPNPDLSLRQGAIAPFRTEQWSKHFRELVRMAAHEDVDIDKPYRLLEERELDLVWNGTRDYKGINGFFRFLEKRAYKMHYRIYHARFRGYSRCPDCGGYRLKPEALYVRVGGQNIGEICELTVLDAREYFDGLQLTEFEESVAGRVLEEIRKRLRYLVEVGLDYLTLDRLSQTLSGGESQRINLATSLGSSLVGSLYVLDEPSIGLHPRDSERLIRILEHLRDIGNTVIVVEHEAEMMKRADVIVDVGPGAGRQGGEIVYSGPFKKLLKHRTSLTAAYLNGSRSIPTPAKRRPVVAKHSIRLENARGNNLKRLDVRFPLGMTVCVTGVSGSGKSTLVNDTLYQGMVRLKGGGESGSRVGAHSAIRGHMLVDRVEMVDQTPIGRTPRSNPITYIKAFSAIRELFAGTYQARIRGYRPGAFSFNVPGGRCEMCQGEGVNKIEMQFLADLYLECEACKGKRYKQDLLEIHYNGKSIDDVLNMTVDEAQEFFGDVSSVARKLKVLQSIGLGYLTLGQPSTTLSGGEAQRIKLASHLGQSGPQKTLYLFDEPTTGLHFDDIRKLLAAFDTLVESGNSVIIVEHNIDVIRCSDWVIDLGPEGGRRGGFVVVEGTPERVASHAESHTGRFLRGVL